MYPLEPFLWTSGLLAISALLGASVTWAIVPRPGGRHGSLLRVGQWLIASSLANQALAAFRSLLNLTDLWRVPDGLAPGDLGPELLLITGETLLAFALAFLLAALLYRRMSWPEVAVRTTWRLDGWRRWVVYLLAAAFFAWPIRLLGWLGPRVGMAWAAARDGAAMADAAGTLLWGLWVTLCITIAAWVLWRLPVSGGGTAAPATDGSRAAWWLAFIGAVGALSTGLEAAFGAVFDLAWSQLQARISPGLALEGWASLLEPLLVLVVSLAPLLYLRHPSWRWLDRVTGRAWTTAGRVLAALTLGAWLGWPVTAVARLVGFWTPAAWPFVGAALLALAVAAAWLYRPGVAPPVE